MHSCVVVISSTCWLDDVKCDTWLRAPVLSCRHFVTSWNGFSNDISIKRAKAKAKRDWECMLFRTVHIMFEYQPPCTVIVGFINQSINQIYVGARACRSSGVWGGGWGCRWLAAGLWGGVVAICRGCVSDRHLSLERRECTLHGLVVCTAPWLGCWTSVFHC